MSLFRRKLLLSNSYENSSNPFDDILGIMLKDKQIIPYSKIPSTGYTREEVIGVTVTDLSKNINFCIHHYSEQKCYFGGGGIKKPDDYSGVISTNINNAILDLDGFNNTEQILSIKQGDNSWACNYCRTVDFSGLQSYVISLGEAKYIESYLSQINSLLLKCNGVEIIEQNYWTSTLNSMNPSSPNIIQSTWITNFRGYRDGANVQAQMFVRPIAKIS